VTALGCGGKRASSSSPDNAPSVASSDTLAYLAIARASGALRASAALAAVGKAPSLENRSMLATAGQALSAVHPRDRNLTALEQTTRQAIDAALSAHQDRSSQHAAAVAAMSATDSINRRLRRYAKRHPELQALVPD
jgi:hypothetical protein